MPIIEFIKLILKYTLSEAFIDNFIHADKKHAFFECLVHLFRNGCHSQIIFETDDDFIGIDFKFMPEPS